MSAKAHPSSFLSLVNHVSSNPFNDLTGRSSSGSGLSHQIATTLGPHLKPLPLPTPGLTSRPVHPTPLPRPRPKPPTGLVDPEDANLIGGRTSVVVGQFHAALHHYGPGVVGKVLNTPLPAYAAHDPQLHTLKALYGGLVKPGS